MLLSVQQIVCTTNMLMLLFVQQIYLCYCLYNKYDYAIVCTTNMLVIVCTTNILTLLSVQQICNVLRTFQSTVKPVLRGHIWDKAKVVF